MYSTIISYCTVVRYYHRCLSMCTLQMCMHGLSIDIGTSWSSTTNGLVDYDNSRVLALLTLSARSSRILTACCLNFCSDVSRPRHRSFQFTSSEAVAAILTVLVLIQIKSLVVGAAYLSYNGSWNDKKHNNLRQGCYYQYIITRTL